MSDKILDRPLQGEAYSRSSTVSQTIIPAGETFSAGVYGERFYFINATLPLEVKTNLTPFKPYRKGTGELFTPEMRFNRLEVKNNNAVAVFIQLWAGFGEYLDTTAELVEGYTTVYGNATSSLAPVSSLTLSGNPSGVQIQRKSVIVSNLSNSDTIYIKDNAGNFVCAVFPLTSITLPVSGIVKVVNSTAGAIPVCISEIWYTYIP
jgi:hypothetical protein